MNVLSVTAMLITICIPLPFLANDSTTQNAEFTTLTRHEWELTTLLRLVRGSISPRRVCNERHKDGVDLHQRLLAIGSSIGTGNVAPQDADVSVKNESAMSHDDHESHVPDRPSHFQDACHVDFCVSEAFSKVSYFGGGGSNTITLSESGLRLSMRPSARDNSSFGAILPLNIEGDFDINASYVLDATPQPEGGYGAGVSLVAEVKNGSYVSLQRVGQKDSGQIYVAHRAVRDSSGAYHHDATQSPTLTKSGSLMISRRGKNIVYSVHEPGTAGFSEIGQCPFTGLPIVAIRLAAQNGQYPAAVDARWVSLNVAGNTCGQKEVVAGKPVPPFFTPTEWIVWGLSLPMAIAVYLSALKWLLLADKLRPICDQSNVASS